jgi:hypothetical protein
MSKPGCFSIRRQHRYEKINYSLMNTTQVHHYDGSKRSYTNVYVDVNSRKRYIYDRNRAVNRSFGSDCITAVSRRVVYDEIQRR